MLSKLKRKANEIIVIPNLEDKIYEFISLLIWIIVISILSLILNDIFQFYTIPINQIVPAGLGAIGTLLLAWVTIRTIEQNKELVRHQKAQVKPVIRRVGEYRVDEKNENDIIFDLENVGYGKAIDIQFKPKLYVRDFSGTGSQPHPTLGEYAQENFEDDFPLVEGRQVSMYSTGKTVDLATGGGGVLDSGEMKSFSTRVDFDNKDIGSLSLDYSSEYPSIIVFSRLLEGIQGEDPPIMGFVIKIEYSDVLGREYEEHLLAPGFDPNEVESLSDVVQMPLWAPSIDAKTNKKISLH